MPIGPGSGLCGAILTRDLLELTTEIVGVQSGHALAYARSQKDECESAANVGSDALWLFLRLQVRIEVSHMSKAFRLTRIMIH